MSDTGSFVIMDIIVTLSDGTTVNVEIQKIGYDFPGERASCYISDFIMRQYNRVKHFSFRDLKPVILIVIKEVEELKRQLAEHKAALSERREQISETNTILLNQLTELSEKDAELSEKDAEIAFLKQQLQEIRSKH